MPPSNSDRIAICGEPYPDALKQYLLFFDRIGIFDLKDRVERRPGTFAHARYAMPLERRRSLGNDLEFLQAKKLVFEVESAKLMKSELANPAKEISYIVKAQEQFGE